MEAQTSISLMIYAVDPYTPTTSQRLTCPLPLQHFPCRHPGLYNYFASSLHPVVRKTQQQASGAFR